MATRKIKTNGTLLWTNPSPTASFAATTLDIDISKYKFLAITVNQYAAGTVNEIATHLIKVGTRGIITIAKDVNSYRVFDAQSPNSLAIGEGWQYNLGGGGAQENKRVVPTAIYGIN